MSDLTQRLQAIHDHLKSASDHYTAAADDVLSILESCCDAEDGDGADGEAASTAAAARPGVYGAN